MMIRKSRKTSRLKYCPVIHSISDTGVNLLITLKILLPLKDTSEVGQEAKGLETEFYELLREHLPGLHNSVCDEE